MPIGVLVISFLFTKKLELSNVILLECLSIVGFFITIFVLENIEKNKIIVDKFLIELGNKDLIIIENDLKILGKSICLSNVNFEEVTVNKAKYSEEIFEFNLSIRKYINIYEDLKVYKEVQNFLRYISECNVMALLQDVRTYDSYVKVMEPLYVFICIEIDEKSKGRLKKWEIKNENIAKGRNSVYFSK